MIVEVLEVLQLLLQYEFLQKIALDILVKRMLYPPDLLVYNALRPQYVKTMTQNSFS